MIAINYLKSRSANREYAKDVWMTHTVMVILN